MPLMTDKFMSKATSWFVSPSCIQCSEWKTCFYLGSYLCKVSISPACFHLQHQWKDVLFYTEPWILPIRTNTSIYVGWHPKVLPVQAEGAGQIVPFLLVHPPHTSPRMSPWQPPTKQSPLNLDSPLMIWGTVRIGKNVCHRWHSGHIVLKGNHHYHLSR